MEQVTHDLQEFENCAQIFARGLSPRAGSATLVTLAGELGAGKTAFVKAAARGLGVEEVVNSPTFVLEKIYQLPAGKPFKRLVHIDAYRLERGSDLVPLGFDEIMRDPDTLVMLEWPERVAGALPHPAAPVHISVGESDARTLSYG